LNPLPLSAEQDNKTALQTALGTQTMPDLFGQLAGMGFSFCPECDMINQQEKTGMSGIA